MSDKNPLDLYKLKGLPFELGRYDVPRVGREDEWRRLLSIVASARPSRSPVIGVLLGTYGSGKSFMLWQLSREFIPSAKSKVVASGPTRLINPEQKKDFTKSLVLRFFTRGLDMEEQLIPLLSAATLTAAKAPLALRPYVGLLQALTKKASASVARRVLGGGRAVRKEAEEAGFPDISNIRTNEDATLLLQAFQLLAKSAGVDVVAILVDEVEYIDNLARTQKPAVLDSLKHLWDQEVDFFSKGNEAAQLVMILSATPNFWQQLTAAVRNEGARGESGVGLVPFLKRIRPSEVVEMPAELAAPDARELIVSRMSEGRPGQTKNNLIPFTDDYVTYVYELSQGLPRTIIEICGVVLTEAAQRKIPEISRPVAKKILREMLITYEPTSKRT